MNIGILTQDSATLNAVLAAINLAGVQEAPPTPAGELGGCTACGHTVGSHFKDGQWTGCLKGTASTVFILVPAPSKAGVTRERRSSAGATAPAVAHDAAVSAEPAESATPRMARRLLYTSAVHHRQNIDNLPLTPTRKKVLKAVHNAPGKHGVLAKQVMARTKLPHGTVQQTLNWLRNQKTPLVVAEDAAATTPE